MTHVSLGVFASWREKGPSFINPTAHALFTAIKELQAANGVVLELKRGLEGIDDSQLRLAVQVSVV